MGRNKGVWKNGKKTITGSWYYIWSADEFVIELDGRDPETGLRRQPFTVKGDNPEFAGWKLCEAKIKVR